MTESFRTARPVQFIAPVDWQQANAPMDPGALEPGTGITMLRGEAAMVGEHHELWWAANGIAFAIATDGEVYLEHRLVRLRVDTPHARVQTMHTRGPDGQRMVRSVTVDWSDVREELHAKGWLRLDPALRSLKVSEHGMFPDGDAKFPAKVRAFLGSNGPLCNAEALAEIARVNEVDWSAVYAAHMTQRHTSAIIQPHMNTLGNDRESLEFRRELKGKMVAAFERWRAAMAGAQDILDGKTTAKGKSGKTAKEG